MTGVTITLDDYRDIGALEEALSAHADEVLKSLTDEQQQIAQTLFRRLTERVVGRGDRRRPSRLRDVAEVAGVTNEAVATVVEEFRRGDRSFLTPPPGVLLREDTILDITHESLITLWQTLNGWVDDESRSAAAYDRLKKTAHDWPKDADVLGGISLERAVEWRRKQQPTVAWARRYGTDEEFAQTIKFLDASEKEWEAHLEHEAAREERDRQNEFERVKLKAKARVARRLQLLTIALAVVAILAVGAAVFAVSASNQAKANLLEASVQRGLAEDQRRRAEENLEEAKKQKDEADKQTNLANEQRSLAAENEKRAIDQAKLAAKREHDAVDAEAIALKAQGEAETARTKAIKLANDLVVAKTEADKKAAEAKASADKYLHELDVAQQEKREKEKALEEAKENLAQYREAQTTLLVDQLQTETQTAFSADASKILTFSPGQAPSVWETVNGTAIKTLSVNGDLLSTAFSRDGRSVATTSEGGEIVLTDVASGKELHRFLDVGEMPRKVILSGDAKRLAVLDSVSGSARVFEVGSGQIARVAGDFLNPIVNMSFSEDGQQLAVTALDGTNKLVQIFPGGQVVTDLRTAADCRSTEFGLVDFKPRPDLRARLSFKTDCIAGLENVPAEAAAGRGLTPEQAARALGPAAGKAKPTEGAAEKAQAQKVTKNTLKKTAAPADSTRTRRGRDPETGLVVTILERYPVKRKVSFVVDQRVGNGEFSELASVAEEIDDSDAESPAIGKLREKGISDDLVRRISSFIIEGADKLARITDDNATEKQEKQLALVREMYRKIMTELAIPTTVK